MTTCFHYVSAVSYSSALCWIGRWACHHKNLEVAETCEVQLEPCRWRWWRSMSAVDIWLLSKFRHRVALEDVSFGFKSRGVARVSPRGRGLPSASEGESGSASWMSTSVYTFLCGSIILPRRFILWVTQRGVLLTPMPTRCTTPEATFYYFIFFPNSFSSLVRKNNTDRPRVEQLRCGSRQTECCMTVWWCHRVADDFWNGARPATLGWGTVTSERGPKERNLAAPLSCFLCCRCQCVVQSGLDFYSSPTEQGWAIRSTLHVFAFWWIARRPAIGSKPRLHHCAARGENCHPDMSFCPQRRQWRHHFAHNSSRRREHRQKFVFLGRLSAVAIGFVPDWLSGNKRKRSEMATRRLVHGSRSGSSYMADPPPLPEEGAVTEMDAVRLAQRMNMDADVHTLLTRQHVTSHVRDHTTDTNRTARKSGMRKITTRVVRQTTTITRGEQRTFNDNVSQHYQHLSSERDTSLYEERVPVPAIEYRPVAIERSVKKVKVMREWAAIQPPDPSTSERLPFWTFFVFYFRRATSCLVPTGPCLISLMHLSLTKFLST